MTSSAIGGQKANAVLIIAGYVFACLGGLIGIIIGSSLISGKVTVEHGERVPKYDQASRTQGKVILTIGIMMTIVWLFIRISMQQ